MRKIVVYYNITERSSQQLVEEIQLSMNEEENIAKDDQAFDEFEDDVDDIDIVPMQSSLKMRFERGSEDKDLSDR